MRTSIFVLLFSTLLIGCDGNKPSTQAEHDQTNSLTNITPALSSDTSTYIWAYAMCEERSYYKHNAYTTRELDNTYFIWQRTISGINANTSAFYPSGINSIDIKALDKEYKELMIVLDTIKVVDTPFWKNFIETQKKERTKEYKLKKVSAMAYNDPSVLLEVDYEDKTDCAKYAKALNADTETLLAAWKTWIDESKVTNGDPEGYVQRYYEKYNSSDRILYARIDLITFAWWNCVNQSINYPDDEIIFTEFNKLFIRTDEFNCEEP